MIVVVLTVALSAILLARDSKRRSEQFSYWRVFLAVAITFFVVGSGLGKEQLLTGTPYDAARFVGPYFGLICFLWFIFLRPRKLAERLADETYNEGTSLLKHGKIQEAYTTLAKSLAMAESDKIRGLIFYNMAVCNLRLGQKETAISMLTTAVSILPSLKSRIAGDKDFTELHNDEQFRTVIAKSGATHK